MATNSQLSTIESKKQTKQTAEEKQNRRNGGHFKGYQLGGGRWRMWEKLQGLRSTNWQVQNRQGDDKNCMGNGEAKELVCMTHGHDLRGEIAGGNGVQGGGSKGGKFGQL